jgi:hypothetical protein
MSISKSCFPISTGLGRLSLGIALLATLAGCNAGSSASSGSGTLLVAQTPSNTSHPIAIGSGTAHTPPILNIPPPPTPVTPTLAFSLTELTPFSANLPSLAGVSGLPAGAVFDQKSNSLRWIPQKGQAGVYTIPGNQANVQLTVSSPASLNQGPPSTYPDGTVGFVYVHGLSQENYCLNPGDLAAYWGLTPQLLSPAPGSSTLSCYDGTRPVEESALIVAQQIMQASCGTHNKCVIVAHSMGNLVMEFILTHARAATAADPEPALFANAALFQQVKSRVIFVISLASAAGGSKIASILTDPGQSSTVQRYAGEFAAVMGQNSPATRSLAVARATTVLAPVNADPGVPFFMVGGFTAQTSNDYGGISAILGNIPLTVYDGDLRYAALDPIVRFSARSDGMVDFRSACGVASVNQDDGPGYGAPLQSQLQYCVSAPKKPSHYLWFLSNLNHSVIATPWANCLNASNTCLSYFNNSSGSGLDFNPAYYGLSSVQVIRSKLQ